MPKTWIESGVFEEFANDCHDENGRFCEGGSAGSEVAPVLSKAEQANRDQIREEILDARAENGKKPLSEASLNVYVIKEASRRASIEAAATAAASIPSVGEIRANAVKAVGGNLGLFGEALTIKDNSWDPASAEYKSRTAEHLSDLAGLPAPLISQFVSAGGKVVVGDGSITDLQMHELANVQPRGWPPGTGYKDVAGVFDPRSSTVILGNVERGPGSGSVSHFALHEFSHGLDELTSSPGSRYISGQAEFKALHVEFVNGARGHMNDYYVQAGNPGAGLSESFADVGRGWFRGLAQYGVSARDSRNAVMRNSFAETGTFVSTEVAGKMVGFMDGKFGTKGVRARKVA